MMTKSNNEVEKNIKDFCIWARVRAIDLAKASGLTRQTINWHSQEDSKTVVRYNKKTTKFEIRNETRVFGSGKIQHVEVKE